MFHFPSLTFVSFQPIFLGNSCSWHLCFLGFVLILSCRKFKLNVACICHLNLFVHESTQHTWVNSSSHFSVAWFSRSVTVDGQIEKKFLLRLRLRFVCVEI